MSSPVIIYPPELPVSAAREEIADAIRDHQVVIVAGATGSGKTTQLPKICLELGRERIAHTQPRRLAARTIAERVADELQVELGTLVGYKVRFTDKVSDDTRIALMTDGILLNEINRDRLLRRYDTIIIDEAHERSLNVDFLLGYLARLLPERPDLKVIITSATIDPESFAKHFAAADGTPAPIIEVSGRTYPVEIRYRGRDEETAEGGEEGDEVTAIVAALRELDREAPGDVLVFLPGEAEIRDAADAVRGAYSKDRSPTEVLPLYGRLSAAEQHRVFEKSRVAGVRRRVVLATNVAETSLTVPGIRYVIDTGTARISRYSNRSKVQRLPIEAISQASANQRSGRAGRTSDGIAIRLYSEEDFEKRPEFTEPEILRTSLASVILQMLSLGFGDITAFPFLTPPDSRGVKAAFDLLTELGAVRPSAGSDPQTLTRIGRDISRIPIDPRFARMLIEAGRPGGTDVTRDVLAIVAGMSIQDVRERPSQEAPQSVRDDADRMHARFADPTSDFLSILNLWNHLREQQRELGSSAFRRLCRSEHLNYVRVREWFDVHRQLRSLIKTKDSSGSGTADPDAIHRALLSGLLSQIGILDERQTGKGVDPKKKRMAEYRGARGIRFSIFPGSALRKKSPQAVMAAEIVETSRTYARTVAAIDPAWAEAIAGDLAKRQVTEPHWSKDAGAAVAYEKVTLFGVEIIPRRRVQFARIDRPASRELFVRHALVEGEWDPTRIDKRVSAFWRSNAELRKRLEKLEERERRRDILAGDEAVFRFYDERIPSDVFDVRSFEKWWREQLASTPKLLVMREADLLDDDSRADQNEFPTRWTQGDQVLGLAYRFEPGAADDGVSVVIPLPLLAQIEDRGFDWQVPGLRAELVTGLLRALPKAIRRHVVPAADWADKFGAELTDADKLTFEQARMDLMRHDDMRIVAENNDRAQYNIVLGGSRPPDPAAREPVGLRGGLRGRPGARAPAHELPRRRRARSRRGIGPRPQRAADAARRPCAQQRRPVDRGTSPSPRPLEGTAAHCRRHLDREGRPHHLDVRRPARGARHARRRRGRARLSGDRRSGQDRLGAGGVHGGCGGRGHPHRCASPRAARRALALLVRAAAPHEPGEARTRRVALPVGRRADRGLPRRRRAECDRPRGSRRHHPHRGRVRACARRRLGVARRRPLRLRVARRAYPHQDA